MEHGRLILILALATAGGLIAIPMVARAVQALIESWNLRGRRLQFGLC
jgi:hypothetical protein